jgi:segregation and condensation protein B
MGVTVYLLWKGGKRHMTRVRHPASEEEKALDSGGPERSGAGPAAEGVRDAGLAAVEALLFAADEPLSSRRLAKLVGNNDGKKARELVRQLQELYDRQGSAFQIEELAGGFQVFTRPEFRPWLVQLRRSANDLRLSGAARETLAIIAYRQPIMRAEIEAIRGVQCGEIIRQLMEKGIVRIAGRHPSLGRPVQYGTTRKFLQQFGLASLKDLPPMDKLQSSAKDDSSANPL